MAEKRKDKRGRVLRTGESQRSDGRYCYRYTDKSGNRQTVYSWKLLSSDKSPDEKPCKSLRELEKDIYAEIERDIDSSMSKRYTLDDAFQKFLDIRKDLRLNTRVCYIGLYEKHVKETIGYRAVGNIRKSDVHKLYVSLYSDGVLRGSSIEKLNSVLYQVFEMCVEDKLLTENPANNVLKKLRKTVDMTSEKRHALTESQQDKFVEFVRQSEKYEAYVDIFTVLLGTGMRIGETIGLTKPDCDFKNDRVFIDHSLSYKPDESGKYCYHINKPKTKAGIRIVPMFKDVKISLKRACKNTSNFSIDGYTEFIFVNGNGKPYEPAFIYQKIHDAISEYNSLEYFNSAREKREPVYLPKFSAHNLRHTFCTRLCENTQDLKAVQDVMGHKNSRTTMDVYNETTEERKMNCFKELEGKLRLA